MTYKYVGTSFGSDLYEVTVTVYRNCLDPLGAQLDNDIMLGVYENVPWGRKLYNGEPFTMPLVSEYYIDPPAAGKKCKEKPPTSCVQKGIYKLTIALPPSEYGYYMQYVRCCRNNSIINTVQDEGQTYYGFISPSKYKNSSPLFDTIPLAYANSNITYQIPFGAHDADGDSLSYRLAWPFQGGDSTQNNIIPNPPKDFMPPPLIDYYSGYSYKYPFGTSGNISINSTTGLLTFKSPLAGNFVIAVDVMEFRNGVALDTVRRDVQLLIVNGPTNPPPKRDTLKNAGIAVAYTVDAGKELDIDFHYDDPTDSLKMTATGELFDVIKPVNKPTFSGTTSGLKNIYPQFKWKTSCKDGRASAYKMQIIVTDNGCPAAATYYDDIFIQVVPPVTAVIGGPSNLCQTDSPVLYTAKRAKGTSLQWYITGGTVAVVDSSRVKITWNGIGKRLIKVVPTNSAGCMGDTAFFNVRVLKRPKGSPISGPTKGCVALKYKYFVTAAESGIKYFWVVKGGRIVSGQDSSEVTVLFNRGSDSNLVKVVGVDSFGCGSDTSYQRVSIGDPKLDSIYGSVSVCPNSSGIDYWVTGEPGSAFYWTVEGGQQVAGGNTSHIKVNWGEKGGGVVTAMQVTSQGCPGDTVKLKVLKDYVLYTSAIRGDSVVCEYTSGKTYEVTYSNGSTYDWKIVGGTIVSGQGTAKIIVDWDKAGSGALTVRETAFDPVNKEPCIGIPVALIVRLSPLPRTSNIIGPQNICEGDVVEYKVRGFDNSKFVWHIRGLLDSTANLSDSIFYHAPLLKASYDTFHIDVTEITADSCIGETRYLTVFIHKRPATNPISGELIVCVPNLNRHVYTVARSTDSTSTFQWTVDGGEIIDGAGTNQITVDWLVEGNRKLSVREVSSFGCIGPEQSITVRVDSLDIEMQYITTGKDNDKQIELYFVVKNPTFLKNRLHIYRQQVGTPGFYFIDSIPNSATTYIDRKVSTGRYSYRYYISAYNSCGTEIKTNVHRSILLHDEFEQDTLIRSHWNVYEGWPIVDYYHLFSSLNYDSTTIFSDLTKDTTLLSDKSFEGYRQSFRVAGLEGGLTRYTSLSNIVSLDLDPILWVPNVFTPQNGDNINNKWRIVVGNYKAYNLQVYNRWGERIFISDDPANQWDGYFHGQICPEGVYLYMVKVTGGKKNLYKSGTVNLLR
jgi:gliding motility-associated-like protein